MSDAQKVPAENENEASWVAVPRPEDFEEPKSEPQFFASKSSAKRFLDRLDPWARKGPPSNDDAAFSRKNQGWQSEPIPVCRLADLDGGSWKGTRFRDFLAPEDVADPQGPDSVERMERFVSLAWDGEKVFPAPETYLDRDWKFEQIAKRANPRPEFRFEAREIKGFAPEIARALCDLEQSLRDVHSILSGPAVAAFWRSWQVFDYVAEICRGLYRLYPIKRQDIRQAQIAVLQQLLLYVLGVEAEKGSADRSDQQSRPKRGPKAKTEHHEKLARIVEFYGVNWKQDKALRKICQKLDKQKVFVPKQWHPVRTWKGGLQKNRERVVKVIESRLKRIGHLPSTNN